MNSNTEVLVIDDDPGVIFLHKIIIRESGLSKQPISFDEALDALDYIVPKISSKDQKIPDFFGYKHALYEWLGFPEQTKSPYQYRTGKSHYGNLLPIPIRP